MKVTRKLPENYQVSFNFDIKNDLRLALALNTAAIGLFLLVYPAISWVVSHLRPDIPGGLDLDQMEGVVLAVGILMVMILHEMLHGLFFWLFTKTRPVFGATLFYAYASAPGWYLPALPFTVTGLAPLVGITALGAAWLPFIPAAFMPEAALLVSLNAAGAAGDLYVVAQLLRQPKDILIEDQGESIRFYLPRHAN